MPYIILILCLAAATALQFLTGGFPVRFFAFPLNLIIALLWICAMLFLWNNRRKSMFVEFMLSRGATVWAIVLFLLFGLVMGVTGIRSVAQSWPFVIAMLYFQTVLLFVLLRGWRAPTATGARLGSVRWRFVLNHLGILLAVSSAFWGAPDSETLRVRAVKGLPAKEAITMDGSAYWLPYEVELEDFTMNVYENGTPSMYEASVLIDDVPVTLRVNHPYQISFGEDLYLVGYDMYSAGDPDYCILQIVREPWKYPAVAGIVLMLMGALLLFAAGPKKRYGEDD